MKTKVTTLILGAAVVIATTGIAIESTAERAEAASRLRQFRGEGIHTCWSSKHIGYSCFVSGVGYADQREALWKLQSINCCKNVIINNVQQHDGRSTAFKLTKLTIWR